jgi:anti-sigma regulatory factor (Ser/Thr protein kinase)
MCRAVTITYAWADATLPAWARSFCHAHLVDLLPAYPEVGRVVTVTELIVSELVTNAVQAASTQVSVTIAVHRDHVRTSVEDDGSGELLPRAAVRAEAGGRGLAIVTSLSRDWGVEPAPAGKRVWAVVPITTRLGATVPCGLEPL